VLYATVVHAAGESSCTLTILEMDGPDSRYDQLGMPHSYYYYSQAVTQQQ
jgi:hypothetical protein